MSGPRVLEGMALLPEGGAGPLRITIESGKITRVESVPSAGGPGGAADTDLLLPGFVDGHTHLFGVGLASTRADLSRARDRRDALEQLDAWLRANPDATPAIAEGFDESRWADRVLPTRQDLDHIAPSRAVAVRRVCGHVAVLNSAALALVGVDWPDLDAGRGLALETLPLSLPRLWPPSRDQANAAVLAGQEAAHREGITEVHEMGHSGSLAAFERADAAGTLSVRVQHYLVAEAFESARGAGRAAGAGSDHLRFAGIKLFLDGSLGGRSAALREAYSDGGTGILLYEDEALAALLASCAREAYPVAMHAIGDRAIDQAIRMVERLAADGQPLPSPGPRIEHAEMMDAGLLARAAARGCFLSMQPNFTARWQGEGELYMQVIGRERARRLNAYRSAAAGGRMHFGSDTMPISPILGIRGALSHPDPAERLDLEAALRAYTEGPPRAVLRLFGAGRLEVGASADLTVLRLPALPRPGAPPLERWRSALAMRDPSILDEASILLTLAGGSPVHRAGEVRA